MNYISNIIRAPIANLITRKKILFFILLPHLLAYCAKNFPFRDLNNLYEPLNSCIFLGLRLFIGICTLILVVPNELKKPTDFYLFIFAFFILASFIFYGFDDIFVFIEGLTILIFPMMLIKHLPSIQIPLKFDGVIDKNLFALSVVTLAILILFYCVNSLNFSLDFSFYDAYTRRILGRTIFPEGSLIAYLISIIANSFLPMTVFIFTLQKRFLLATFSIFLSSGFFIIEGLKLPTTLACIGFAIGLLCRKGQIQKLGIYLSLIFVLLSSIQLLIGNLTSPFGTFFIDILDRFFYSVGETISYYLFILHSSEFNYFTGTSYINGPAYLVGSLFNRATGANANVNWLLYSLSDKGLFFYIFNIFVFCLFCLFINKMWSKKNPHILIFFSILHALIISEQGLLTSMISSGFLFLFLALILLRDEYLNIRSEKK
jgi:hypothetical protein